MGATRSYHLTTRGYGSVIEIWAVFLDGSRRNIAILELPESATNYDADYEFIQDIKTAYKKRFAKIY